MEAEWTDADVDEVLLLLLPEHTGADSVSPAPPPPPPPHPPPPPPSPLRRAPPRRSSRASKAPQKTEGMLVGEAANIDMRRMKKQMKNWAVGAQKRPRRSARPCKAPQAMQGMLVGEAASVDLRRV